jgi:DNA-binding CsgD family transcriptional regulator
MSDPHTVQDPRKSGPKLHESQRQAIVAAAWAGISKSVIAQRFNVNRNTVYDLVKSRKMPVDAQKASWREEFDKLPELCTQAVTSALKDDSDNYKRAGVAQTHLKGVGIYAADSVTNNVLNLQLGSLPPDWRQDFIDVGDVSVDDRSGGDSE